MGLPDTCFASNSASLSADERRLREAPSYRGSAAGAGDDRFAAKHSRAGGTGSFFAAERS
jgi:hypothetical protein